MVLKTCEMYAKCVELNTVTQYTNVKDNLILCRCLFCNKDYQKMFNVVLKKRFFNTNKFSIHDIIKLILLSPKGLDPYDT